MPRADHSTELKRIAKKVRFMGIGACLVVH